jgi:hypothetical protein
VSGP